MLLCIRHPLRCPLCPSTAFLVFVVLPPHLLLEASSGARPQDSRNSSLTPTCVTGFQIPALAGPISGSTHPSSGYKSLQGMPFGLSGSAHGSFLWYVAGRTRSGEQERQQKVTPCTALPPLGNSSSSAVNQKHLFFRCFPMFSLKDQVPELTIRIEGLRKHQLSFLFCEHHSHPKVSLFVCLQSSCCYPVPLRHREKQN